MAKPGGRGAGHRALARPSASAGAGADGDRRGQDVRRRHGDLSLIRHAGASRVLFLVDRNNLGEQAEGEFTNYTAPDDGRRFGDLHNVQRLAGCRVHDSTNVAISTIQRLFRMLQGEDVPAADIEINAEGAPDEPPTPVEVVYNAAIPPETFDLIVVDECHRSIYGRWRAVLEYFDAPIVGLTATPTKQTLGFFDQNIVSEYSYEKSVADGVNVPFSVYRIRTRITEQGASIEAGTVVPVRDRRTRARRYQELEDDYSYSGAQLGRAVIAEDQIRTVLETFRDRLFAEIFPRRSAVPKTLIFAKDDNHADVIVQQVREVFGKGQDFATKITYRSKNQGNYPKRLLQEFRNSVSLRVAVTVDMIATGTDVRAIECVFFLREVRSAVYFEQMKGRGARIIGADEYAVVTPDAVGGRTKDHFVIVDAVGVTDSPLVDATPMERLSPSVSLETLLHKTGTLTITPDEVSTLLARLNALERQLTPPQRDELAAVAGGPSLRDIVRQLGTAADPDAVFTTRADGGEDAVAALMRDAVAPLTGNPDLRDRILEIRREKDILFDEVNADELLGADRVDHGREPMDRVASFRNFLRDHTDELAALQVLHGSGSGRPTYAQLAKLAERVARVPAIGAVDCLWRAYAELGEVAEPSHRAGVVDLVTILRHELAKDHGEAADRIDPFASVIEARLEAWLAAQRARGVEYSEPERWWMRVCDVVKSSLVVEMDDLDRTPFTERGGTFGFVRDFGDAERARAVLNELNQELTA
ncbi:MAG TPA: type I restriction-modification enzyme R subunit C-terminal domain-containing protein [Pseudonocardiaceae bacterium]|nr:type I restriction-modification enzyme R subunit C-terminal domain-containing protein [Pseudonocardiaceae bacterium]